MVRRANSASSRNSCEQDAQQSHWFVYRAYSRSSRTSVRMSQDQSCRLHRPAPLRRQLLEKDVVYPISQAVKQRLALLLQDTHAGATGRQCAVVPSFVCACVCVCVCFFFLFLLNDFFKGFILLFLLPPSSSSTPSFCWTLFTPEQTRPGLAGRCSKKVRTWPWLELEQR